MSDDKPVSMYEILTAIYPQGALWVPKRFELGTSVGTELVTNGDFSAPATPPNIPGWTVYDTTGSGEGASVALSSGKAQFYYWAV
jgi:hypothetical protein